MRSLFTRLALVGTFGIAIVGCGTQNGTSLPTSGAPNGTGGGNTNISQQNPPAAGVQDILIDGGVVASTNTYLGVNTTAVDTQSAVDAGTDPNVGAGLPVDDPAGSHSITFNGTNVPQIIFRSTATIPALYYTGATPGSVQPVDYGAIVLYASVTPAAVPPAAAAPSVAVELTGGSGATTYDVRSTCAALPATGAMPGGTLARYVCALPPYGTATGTSASVTLKAAAGTTPAVTSSYSVDTNISNPRIADATGSFTPASPTFYVELIYGSSLTSTASTGNVLGLDYVYAEAGTK